VGRDWAPSHASVGPVRQLDGTPPRLDVKVLSPPRDPRAGIQRGSSSGLCLSSPGRPRADRVREYASCSPRRRHSCSRMSHHGHRESVPQTLPTNAEYYQSRAAAFPFVAARRRPGPPGSSGRRRRRPPHTWRFSLVMIGCSSSSAATPKLAPVSTPHAHGEPTVPLLLVVRPRRSICLVQRFGPAATWRLAGAGRCHLFLAVLSLPSGSFTEFPAQSTRPQPSRSESTSGTTRAVFGPWRYRFWRSQPTP